MGQTCAEGECWHGKQQHSAVSYTQSDHLITTCLLIQQSALLFPEIGVLCQQITHMISNGKHIFHKINCEVVTRFGCHITAAVCFG